MTAINDSTYRQTKIIATLGPKTSSKESIEGLINAGVDLIRLNFSHSDKESHIKRAKIVREVAEKKNYHVGIMFLTSTGSFAYLACFTIRLLCLVCFLVFWQTGGTSNVKKKISKVKNLKI